jgi:hypothetical protein
VKTEAVPGLFSVQKAVRWVLFAALGLGIVAVLGCSSGTSGANCPVATMPADAVWRDTMQSLEESIRLAEAGRGKEAIDLFFGESHDNLHLIAAALCATDEKRARSLNDAIEDFHFEFDPDDSRALRQLFVRVHHELSAAAEKRGVTLS